MRNTNDDLSVVLFKMLVACLSLAITMPSLLSKSYHVFMLTTFVFIFGKLVDSIESFIKSYSRSMSILYAIGCVLGILALMCSVYYLGSLFEGTKVENAIANNGDGSVKCIIALWMFPFLVSAYYIIVDFYHLGCVLYKYYATKKQTLKYQNI